MSFAFNTLAHEGRSQDKQAAASRRAPRENPEHVNKFFDDLYEPISKMANDLNVDENWLLALASYESGWYNEHNRGLKNPFGLTRAGGRNLSL